jgi:hypothetical protein
MPTPVMLRLHKTAMSDRVNIETTKSKIRQIGNLNKISLSIQSELYKLSKNKELQLTYYNSIVQLAKIYSIFSSPPPHLHCMMIL